jgi:hypothetical protein
MFIQRRTHLMSEKQKHRVRCCAVTERWAKLATMIHSTSISERKITMRHIILFLAMMSLISCNKDEGPTGSSNTGSGGIIPLKIGNSWTFRITSASGTFTATNSINQDTTINNEKWFLVGSNTWGTNRADGFWFIKGTNPPLLAYKYPASVGDSCQAAYYLSTKILSINDTITVPAGRFPCYKYQSNRTDYPDHRLEMIEWYAPNIGPVRIKQYSSGNLSSVSELTAYTLN